ncbi:MAG: ASCH domain-containing protein [Alphaproteobacteria bacterium]
MDKDLLKLPILSIRQPWAWLIVNGYKDIENRTWPTHFRGKVLIHAGKKWDEGIMPTDIKAMYGVEFRGGWKPVVLSAWPKSPIASIKANRHGSSVLTALF